MSVEYPHFRSFGQTVHWLDVRYAMETMTWSKHANVCLQSHQNNLVVLLLDTDDVGDPRYERVVTLFKESLFRPVNIHKIELVPVIYAVRQGGPFGDESERLEHILNIQVDKIKLPQILMIHGLSRRNLVFEHSVGDVEEFTAELLAYWIVNQVLRADLNFKRELLTNLQAKLDEESVLRTMPADIKKEKQMELLLTQKSVGEIEAIVDRSDHAYKFAVLKSRYAREMRLAGVTEDADQILYL